MGITKAYRTVNGEVMSLSQAAARFGIPFSTIHRRVYSLGWTLQEAATTPILSVGHPGSKQRRELRDRV